MTRSSSGTMCSALLRSPCASETGLVSWVEFLPSGAESEARSHTQLACLISPNVVRDQRQGNKASVPIALPLVLEILYSVSAGSSLTLEVKPKPPCQWFPLARPSFLAIYWKTLPENCIFWSSKPEASQIPLRVPPATAVLVQTTALHRSQDHEPGWPSTPAV